MFLADGEPVLPSVVDALGASRWGLSGAIRFDSCPACGVPPRVTCVRSTISISAQRGSALFSRSPGWNSAIAVASSVRVRVAAPFLAIRRAARKPPARQPPAPNWVHPHSIRCASGNHRLASDCPPPRDNHLRHLPPDWPRTSSLTNTCRGSLVPGKPPMGEWPTSLHPSWAEEPPRDQAPSAGILRAHGVTPAHHFLHVRAKTSGASSCLSEPPEGVGLAPASRMASGERVKDRPLGEAPERHLGQAKVRPSEPCNQARMASPNRRRRLGCIPPAPLILSAAASAASQLGSSSACPPHPL
jgi:hypothetical protein